MTDPQTQRRDTATKLACIPYERALYVCLQCGREDENCFGKLYGRFRYCSVECESAVSA